MKKKISPSSLLFISSITLLLSSLLKSTESASLIHHACYDDPKNIDTQLCMRVLQSIPSVVSAIREFNLSIAILEAGILNSSRTHEYIDGIRGRIDDSAFEECMVSYNYAAGALSVALLEVKDHSNYVTISDELFTRVPRYMKKCQDILVKKKIKDETIFIGNRVVPIFARAAYSNILRLWNPDPSSNHV